MVLRRVIQHFRKQEWIAIGIDLVRGHLSEIAQDLQRQLDFGHGLEGSVRLHNVDVEPKSLLAAIESELAAG